MATLNSVSSHPSMQQQISDIATSVGKVATLTAGIGILSALIYKVAGAALSCLSGGHVTFLGTVVTSSPYFTAFIGLSAGVAAVAWLVKQACE